MSATPRGSRLASFDDDGESDGDSFAGHSGLNSSPNFGPTNSSVEQQGYGGYNQYGSQARSQETTMSSAGAPSLYSSRTNDNHTCSTCSLQFRRTADLNRHQRTIHANNGARPYKCEVPDCQAGVTSWAWEDGLQAHKEQWHSSSSSQIPSTQAVSGYYAIPKPDSTSTTPFAGPSTTFAVPDLYPGVDKLSLQSSPNFTPADSQQSWSVAASKHTRHVNIRTKNPSTTMEEIGPYYKVHRDIGFKYGRIFKVLWSEPRGFTYGDYSILSETEERRGKNLWDMFQEVRRFVIIQPMAGHCICLPIFTYGGRGAMKPGIRAKDHAPMYNTGGEVAYGPGEKKRGLTREPIEVHCDPRHKLDKMSRLNYAKTYTVEYNVKVLFIGKIAKASEGALAKNYNDVHPPLKVPTTSDVHLEPTSSSSEPRNYTQPLTSGTVETAPWSSYHYNWGYQGYQSASTLMPDENAINRDGKDEGLPRDSLYDPADSYCGPDRKAVS
ncbi:hypothetical protein DL95DRAFT_519408 [Leptodontidium sp. 2 PMI_412]|nr:hypothetical protein DL95DRAFT_519408 [Leptodontidium sp. 2 PMI_412]